MNPQDTSPEETLCLSCGMCCDGTIHYWTRLENREKSRAKKLGLRVFDRKTPVRSASYRSGTPKIMPAFRQPCAALAGLACQVYAQRPKACVDYVCPLLARLQAGEIALAEALANAQHARRLIADLSALLDDPIPELPLAVQAALNWGLDGPQAEPARAVFNELAALLRSQWGVRWGKPKRSNGDS